MAHRERLSATVLVTMLLATVAVNPAVAATEEPTYLLPAPEGTTLLVAQGNNSRAARTGAERFAFDFATTEDPQPFPVVASRGGTVMSQRFGIRGGRCFEPVRQARPACWREVNHVLIDHGDGTSGLYMHLKRGRPMVRTGDVVSAGQPIGTAGRTGWTNRTGLQFQLQRTPTWNNWGRGGWFQTQSMPVSFVDASVLEQRPDGVPLQGDVVVSDNAAPIRDPFRFQRRTVDLPAALPFEAGESRDISSAYDADSVDGYGLSFAPAVEAPPAAPAVEQGLADASADPLASPGPQGVVEPPLTDPGTVVRPLFAGELLYAGCGFGESASLGRMIVVSRILDDGEHLAVLGHLSDIDPELLDRDPDVPLLVGANQPLGHYGVVRAPGEAASLDCPEADPGANDLFAEILRDATVSDDGEISGGVPVSPEPLLGRGAYEGFDWWDGPVTAVAIGEDPGRPRVNWNRRTPAHASHVRYGDAIRLIARVRNAADIQEVRLRAYYPRWPRVSESRQLEGVDPKQTWRQLAVCRPPGAGGQPRRTRGCQWNGDSRDAVVSFTWDPIEAEAGAGAPWLPSARTAMTRAIDSCVPVSFAVEVVDSGGYVRSQLAELPTPTQCDRRAVDRSKVGRVLYLDPLVPPNAPTARGNPDTDRAFPYDESVFGPDPLDGYIGWRDRADNEDGYYVYVRRNWLLPDCSTRLGSYVRVATLPENTRRYKPRHQQNLRRAPAPQIEEVPGYMTRYEMYVSAYNAAGESKRIPVGGFIAGGEAFCDAGLVPPPDL